MATVTRAAIINVPRMRLRPRQRTNRGRAPERASGVSCPRSPDSGDPSGWRISRSMSSDVIGTGLEPHSRIEEGVDHVGAKIDEDDQDREDERRRLHEWVVAG